MNHGHFDHDEQFVGAQNQITPVRPVLTDLRIDKEEHSCASPRVGGTI